MKSLYLSCCLPVRRFLICFTLGFYCVLAGCDADSSGREQPGLATDQQSGDNELLDPSAAIPVLNSTAHTNTNDGLLAPGPPSLSIRAEAEALIFQWIHDQAADRVLLFQQDRETGEETLLDNYAITGENTIRIPSNTPHRRWNNELFRVELCASESCISSERVGIAGLTANTGHTLRPSVFVEQERYAESFALSTDVSVLISSLPAIGSIDIYLRSDDHWVSTQRYKLPEAMLSETRQLLLASSANGDTLAILEIDTEATATTQLTILERLGESWIATATWPIDNPIDKDGMQNLQTARLPPTRMQISDNGNQLLLHIGQTLTFFLRELPGWSIASTLSVPQENKLLTVVADRQLDNVVSLERESGGLWLTHWSATAEHWQRTSRQSISGIQPTDDVVLTLNTDASRLMISGWEDVESSQQTPVAWRFTVGPSNQVQVQDSLRGIPAWNASAQLHFAASRDLDIIAIGWNNMNADDALISTYQYDMINRRWRMALQLPEAIPTLAKQAFAGKLRISEDGSTLLIANPHTAASSELNRVGELMIFR